LAHCTSDLQLAGLSVALVRSPAAAPVLVVEAAGRTPDAIASYEPPPGGPPRRILLHSFLI
jgi:hypothetical protein